MNSLEHDGIFSSFEEYAKSLSVYMENRDRIEILCEKYHQLSGCVTNSAAKECINKDSFKSIDTIWNDEPIKFVANYYVLEFMCSDKGHSGE